MEIRPLNADDDLAAVGQMIVDAYLALPGGPAIGDYADSLRDVAGRVATDLVFGAIVDDVVVGCVTYVNDPDSPNAEFLEDGEASFRMLAVGRDGRGQGIGDSLVHTCIALAASRGRRGLFISTGEWMTAAHRIYARHGFTREPRRDWVVDGKDVALWGMVRTLP